jgi:hypothetical protein
MAFERLLLEPRMHFLGSEFQNALPFPFAFVELGNAGQGDSAAVLALMQLHSMDG